MTVAKTYNKKTYNCDGSAVDFGFDFNLPTSINPENHLIVKLRNTTTGAVTTLAFQSGDYAYDLSATNNDYTKGFTVTTTKLTGAIYEDYAWSSDYTLMAMRQTVQTQEADFIHADGLDQETLEGTFDYSMMIKQDEQEKIDRSIRVPPSDPCSGDDLLLPDKVDRAGYPIGCDADGKIMAFKFEIPTARVSAFGATLIDDADASAALTTLGLSAFIKTLMDDADAATARATLGVNAIADIVCKNNQAVCKNNEVVIKV